MPMTAHSIKQLEQAAGEISHVQALDIIENWSVSNKMTINVKKTKGMWICFTESVLEPPPVYIGDELVERVDTNLNYLEWGFKTTSNGTIMLKLLYSRKANRQVYILKNKVEVKFVYILNCCIFLNMMYCLNI